MNTPAGDTAAGEVNGKWRLRRGPRKIGEHALAAPGERQRQQQRLEPAAHEGLQIVFVEVGAVRQGSDRSTHARLRPIEIETYGFEQGVHAVASADLAD